MPYLIDGHNLIPKCGLNLASMDDEMELITQLQSFCRSTRKQVEVYFDGAPAGQDGKRRYGKVTAHFVRQGTTADAAIRRRLKGLGKAACNWSVVSSDREVQTEARQAGARVLTSEEFAHELWKSLQPAQAGEEKESQETSEEINEWIKKFRERGKKT
ncbi:MAG: NYN domain-containing protein [Anaerolineales bacterium]|nr:NYN domain-containing protein [Anaerolineales bacterium]